MTATDWKVRVSNVVQICTRPVLLGICTRIHYDLPAFENNDRPVYDVSAPLAAHWHGRALIFLGYPSTNDCLRFGVQFTSVRTVRCTARVLRPGGKSFVGCRRGRTVRSVLEQNCNIKKIRHALACSIEVDATTAPRYRFTLQ